jgi:hypothetical protein
MAKLRKEKGTMLVLVSAGVLVLLGASALSVDVGYVYVVRNQMQNCADAAVLAGAAGLYDQPGNYTASGKAVMLARDYANRNRYDGKACTLQTSEITFPEPNVILVDFMRPSRTFFGQAFGVRQVNIRVRAAASVTPADGGTGDWRPWAPPDQFGHGGECVSPDTSDHDFYDAVNPHVWRGVTATDNYMSPYDPAVEGMDLSDFTAGCPSGSPTGYMSPRDENGRRISIKVDQTYSPGNFFPVALGTSGASNYRANIREGWPGTIKIGDILTTETGNMVGPTSQGVQDLINQCPSSRLVQTAAGKYGIECTSGVHAFNESPRIVHMPLFAPNDAPGNGRTTFRVANIASFWIESVSSGEVHGYFIHKRMRQGHAAQRPRNNSNRTSGASGRLTGVIQPVDPNQYQ